jgi:hypothetical protein
VHGDHGGDCAETVQNPELTDVGGVQDQIDVVQYVEDGRGKGGTALGHVGV